MRNFLSILSISLLFAACGDPNIETITVKDDAGKLTEKYQRSKKNSDKQGEYQRFYPNGKVKEQGTYQANKLEGVHKFFYESGTCEIEENYRAGELHGVHKKFYESGKLNLELNYENGVLVGKSSSWYQSGTLKEEVIFVANEENGPFIEYHENGSVKAKGTYLDGPNEQDSLYMYDTGGQLERVMFCQNGICNTVRGKKTSE